MDIKTFSKSYFHRFQEALNGIESSDKQTALEFGSAMEQVHEMLIGLQKNDRKLMIIGNGGSAATASHMILDFWKNSGVKAMTFNDVSLLTAVANDYSYEDVFKLPVQQFAEPGDLLICISSSGGSENILRGAQAAQVSGCKVVTCSGFSPDNPLRKMGDVNFYVPAYSYGFVETIHQLLIHAFLDAKMYCSDKLDIFHKNQPMDA